MRHLASLSLAVSLLLPGPAGAQTATSADAKVQAPELAAPQRGSLIGQLATTVFGPADVSRGAFTLPSPFVAPAERGPLLAPVFPTYSPDAGISEWGIGWTAALAVVRSRITGDLDCATDDLTGPWGRMIPGTDGFWYPVGLSKAIRGQLSGDTFTAWLPDGTRQVFGGAGAVVAGSCGIYAWHLVEVASPTLRKTLLSWQPNGSGRLFLASVSYGGTGDDFQHRIDLSYVALPVAFSDYRSGSRLLLDQRVSRVTVSSKNRVSGIFEERWRDDLAYLDEGFGPGFYLSRVQRTYRPIGASPAQTAPAVVYTYDLARDHLAAVSAAESPKLSAILRDFGTDVLQPTRSTPLDAEADGLQDLEHNTQFTLLHQGSEAFAYEPLPPAPADVYGRCRRPANPLNPARLLAKMAGDDTPYVVDMNPSVYRTSTALSVCNRLGRRVGAQTLSGDWSLSSTLRLADLNRDHRPDLLRYAPGSYRVLPNTSSGTAFSFGTMKQGTLSPAVSADTVWVHDFNGDGIPDLVARTPSALVVWYGRGSYQFDPQGQTFALRNGSLPVTSLPSYSVTFLDANKDGLTDVLLSPSGATATLFINRGGGLLQAATVPALANFGASTSLLIAADFTGSGNTELAFIRSGSGFALPLDSPRSGLLATVDDGKGTVLQFGYERAAPAAGLRHRPPVLARLTVESSGYAPITYTYGYQAPRAHSQGRFLLGFDDVTRTDPLVTERSSFLNEDHAAGVLVSTLRHDAKAAGADALATREYEDVSFRGVPWKRLSRERSGFQDPTGVASVTERTEITYDVDGLCPATETRATASGTLTTTKTYVHPDAFGNALSCLLKGAVTRGSHFDPSLDFTHETALTRNAVGLVEKVESVNGAERVVLQAATYRPTDWMLESLSTPGRGTSTFGFDAVTLASITTPEGVVVRALARDPLHDGILSLQTERGTSSYVQSFRFDGQERLQRHWDDIGSSSELNPVTQFAYRYATAQTPAAVFQSELIDAAQASARDTIDLLTAAGDRVTAAHRTPRGWAVAPVATRSRATAETKRWVRPALGAAVDPMTIDYAALLSGANPVQAEIQSAHGHASESRTTYHAGVERVVTAALSVSGGLLRLTTTENGQHSTDAWMDGAKRVLAWDDEAGTRYDYTYDALGRLREVKLPDGRTHRARYDGHGRIWRIERAGVATIELAFDPVTGLLRTKKYSTHADARPANALVRTVSFDYDAAGRVRTESHVPAGGGPSKLFTYFYDGASPATPTARTTAGLLTGVSGDGYTKALEYRADGRLSRRVLKLGSWRTVETTLDYLEGGTIGARTVRTFDGLGTPLSASAQTFRYDGNGRLWEVKLNGALLATLSYDDNGLLSGATFANGDTVVLSHDALTRRPTGAAQTTADYSAATTLRLNARGLVDTETFTVGPTNLSRTYGYTAQRFLSDAVDSRTAFGYGFDGFGLPRSVTRNGVTRAIVEAAGSLTAGTATYAFDGLRRTVSRADAAAPSDTLTLEYGADGQLATATRAGKTFTFVHDEAGQRLVKLAGGTPVAAYLEEGFLDEIGLTERFQLGGRTVGLIQDGVLHAVPTDLRGTVIAEPTGEAAIASPFGQRDVHPMTAAAIDYVEKGFDADLGFVRMGVRDYDPQINRFTTADPLYLEKPDLCLKDAVSCNLYAYARGAPTVFVDPNGEDIWEIIGGAGDAVRSNTVFGLGRAEHGSADFRLGQRIGDALSVIQGGVEFLAGLTGGTGGLAVTSTGVLAPAGVGMMAASAAVGTHGAGVFATGVRNLFRNPDSGGTDAGGGDKLPRYEGSKPKYHVNDAHVPGPKFNPKKEPLPPDAEEVYKRAVPDAPEGAKNWYGKNAEGVIYRYSNAGDGTAHFSGSSASESGIRNITEYAVKRLAEL